MQRHSTVEELLNDSGWLRALAGHLVADAGRAEDLVQDTWLAALRRPPAPTTPGRPWLARVLRNRATNDRRAAERRAQHEGALEARPESESPARAAEQAEAQRLLAEEIVRLPEELRTVVVLRYFRGLDSVTIARELAIPAGTVRWRLARALDELRAALDRRSGGERRAWAVLLARVAPPAEPVVPWIGAGAVLVGTIATLTVLAVLAWRPHGRAAGGEPLSTSSTPVAGATDVHEAQPQMPTKAVESREASAAPDAAATTESPLARARISGWIRVEGAAPKVPVRLSLHRPVGGRATSTGSAEAQPGRTRKIPSLVVAIEAGGAFRIDGLEEGYTGRLSAEGFVFRDGSDSILVTAPSEDLLLELRPQPSLRGSLLRPDGSPASAFSEGRYAIMYGEPEADGSFFSFGWMGIESDGTFVHTLEHDEGAPAHAFLTFEGNEGYLVFEVPPFDLEAGIDVGSLQLEPTRALVVRVLDTEGAPVSGAVARVASPIVFSHPTEPTDEHGTTRMVFAPARPFELRVDALRFASVRVPVASEEGLTVVMPRTASLEVVVQGAPASAQLRLVATGLARENPSRGGPRYEWLELELRNDLVDDRLSFPLNDREGRVLFALNGDGRAWIEPIEPGVTVSVELQDSAQRPLAVRTTVLAEHEWQTLEFDLR
ncbi:MAG: RNA polymerase sigma factor [Planctomycetota bacterium]